MEKFKIYSRTHKLLRQQYEWPDKYVKLYGFPRSYKASIVHGKNILLFQRIPIAVYYLDQSDYLIYDPQSSAYFCKSDEGGITIQFCLLGKAHFNMFGKGWRYVSKGSHNMNVFGSVENDVAFKETSHHKIFEISISKEKLLELSEQYTFLKPLLSSTEKGCNQLLFQAPERTTTEMYLLLSKIIYNLYKTELNILLIKDMIDQLITVFFENVTAKLPESKFDFETVMGIYMSEVYMQEYYRTDGVDSARTASSLNTNNFSKAFKHVYKHSPMQYLKSIRMERAKEILLSGNQINNLKDLPKLVGFSNLKYFLTEYFKYHGVTAMQHFKEGEKY